MKKYLLSFLDFQTCMLAGFAALFVLSALKMNEETKKGNIIDPAQYIIEMTWEDGSPDDIDLWVKAPGSTINWRNTDTGVLSLDRDDRGSANNDQNGVTNTVRREVVSIRRIIPGEYTVNAMMFKNRTGGTDKAKIVIRRLNPYQEVIEKTVELTGEGEEKTIVSFTLDEKGNIISKDETERSLLLQ